MFSVLLFSAMQMNRPFFAATQFNTILGGFIGSWLFVLALTVRKSTTAIYLLRCTKLKVLVMLGGIKFGIGGFGSRIPGENISRNNFLPAGNNVCLWHDSSRVRLYLVNKCLCILNQFVLKCVLYFQLDVLTASLVLRQ